MGVTYKEYTEACDIVAKWDEKCAEVRKTRNVIDWKEHSKLTNIIWRKREELNRELYNIKSATPEQIKEAGEEFLETYIKSLRLSLLKLRLRRWAN